MKVSELTVGIPLLLLVGCSRGDHPDPSEWACTKVGVFNAKEGMMAGTAYLETTVKRTGCVQWTRMEYENS